MTGLKVDWGTDDKEYKALPNGPYHTTVTGAHVTKNKDQTQDMVELEFTITDADHTGRKLWERASLQKAAWKVRKNFEALGVWPKEAPTTLEGVAELCGTVIGKAVEVKVSTREYQGKFYNNAEPVKLIDTDNLDAPF